MTISISVTVKQSQISGARLLVPVGIPTPHQSPVSFRVDGGALDLAGEISTGQMAAAITPHGTGPITVTYVYQEPGSQYPETMFLPRQTRYTRAADALVADVRELVDRSDSGHALIEKIVNDVAKKFSYGHPDVRFNDGLDEVPYLSCGLTEGSCIDINTYLIACLRAAGIEAGYVYGYFFPEEKKGTCVDGHCWVVTRHDGEVLEWDIAHHLKLGTRNICCGLNPKPGHRVATAHSMGLTIPVLGLSEIKLIGEPMWVAPDGSLSKSDLDIRCEHSGGALAAE